MKPISTFLASDQVFEKLCALCVSRDVSPGTVLFRQGDAPKEVYLVLQGDVALTPVPTEPSLCRLAGPGSVLGLPANLSGRPYSLTAVTGQACKISSVPRKQFVKAIRRDPEVTLGIVHMLAKEVSQMQNLGVQFRLAHLEELDPSNQRSIRTQKDGVCNC